MNGCPRTRCHNQATVCYACKGRNAALYFDGLAYVDWPNVDADCGRRRLDNNELSNSRRYARITKPAARVTLGAISFNNSSHFPLRLYSNCMKPVTLPPGCARLSTNPAPTGSGAIANTIGMSRCVRKAPAFQGRQRTWS